MNQVIQLGEIGDSLNPRAQENELLNEIAYYKARLADIEKSPRESKHRDRWSHVSSRLRESQDRLAMLRNHPRYKGDT